MDDLATPNTLRIIAAGAHEHLVCGGEDGGILIAVFASPIAAAHFVRYCVEFEKTFVGVRL